VRERMPTESLRLRPGDQIVVLITGHGLKDVDAPLRHLSVPAAIEPTSAGLAGVAHRLTQKGGLG
jgi:threonine synthase